MHQWQTILKAGLFIALLLGILTVVFIKRNRKEGFQVPSNSSCTAGVEPSGLDPLPAETPDEGDAYDFYELLNIPEPKDMETTPLDQYETAGALGDFDTGAEIPWDYDNLSQNPKDMMWGMVVPICSQSIFRKAYLREVLGSANKLEWDEGQQQFKYRSHQFQTTYTDPGTAKAIQFAEFFQDYATENFFEQTIDYWVGASWNAQRDAAKEAFKASKEARQVAKAKGVSKAAIKAAGDAAYKEAFDKAKQTAIQKIAADRSAKLRLNINIVDDLIKKASLKVNQAIGSIFARTFASRAVSSGKAIALAGNVAEKTVPKTLSKKILAAIGPAAAKAALAKMSGQLAARLAALGAKMVTVSATTAGFLAFVAPILSVFIMVYTFSCITWIPALLNEYADPEGECPPGSFNLRDAVVNSSGAGEVGWEILSNIPVIGDGMYAFGPYLCTKKDGSTVLRQSVYNPYYYYDSTLSLFFDEDRPLKLKPGDNGAQYGNSVMWTPMYTDKRKFQYADGRYPIWVDFAEQSMLDKMAQYYLDMSRRYIQVDISGNYYYDYISKFYGIIASSMYSCDVQVELTRVIINPGTGLKVDEKVQPRPVDTGMRYSDRRFYFMVDMTKGAIDPQTGKPYLRTKLEGLVRGSGGDSYLNILMQDNMERYVITGCTNTDMSAPDCQEVTEEGQYVGDAVVALGPPGGQYNPPVLVDESGGTSFPVDQTCNIVKSNYTRWTYRPTASDPGSKDDKVNGGRTSLMLSALQAPWGPTPKFSEHAADKVTRLEGRLFPGPPPSSGERGGNIVLGSAMGALPFVFSFKGGLLATIADTAGLTELLNCLWQDLRNQTGTYVINGNLVANQENFIWFRGPTIEWAPGYRPNLTFCNKTTLLQTDCASRYALRRFVYRFNEYQKSQNQTRRLTRVYKIEPRQKTTRNAQPMCVYAVKDTDTAQGVPVDGTEREYRIGVLQEIDVASKTCSWRPIGGNGAFIIEQPGTTTLPSYEPIILDSTRYELADATVNGVGMVTEIPQLTKLGIATDATATLLRKSSGCNDIEFNACHSTAMKNDLLNKFNELRKADSPDQVANPRMLSIEKAWTRPVQRGEDPACVYYAKFQVSEPTLDSSAVVLKEESRTIEFVLRPALPNPADTKANCKYDLASDSYPTKLIFGPIPKTWFEVPQPPICKNQTFLRTGCVDDPDGGIKASDYADCSGLDIMNELVTQFNIRNPTRKILRVTRASTPLVGTEQTCDYEVDMQRSIGDGKTVTARERVRMILAARTTGTTSRDRCIYDLARDLSAQPNSGTSLTVTSDEGTLTRGYLWSVSFVRDMTTKLNSYIMGFLNNDVPGTLKTVSTQAKTTMNTVLRGTGQLQTLTECGAALRCDSDDVLRAVMNRYNYDTAVPYPDGPQYGFIRRTIEEIRRAGVATPGICHYELIEKVQAYKDALKKPDDVDVRVFLRRFRFNVSGNFDTVQNKCLVTVGGYTPAEIQAGAMDISGNAYGIDGVPEISVKNPAARVNPQVAAAAVKAMYESKRVNETRPTDPKRTNTLRKFTRIFQPRPNVIEYVAIVDHVYWDADYGMYYTTTNDETYIVAKWEGAAYDVQTGVAAAQPTSVEEFFPPTIEFRSDGVYKNGTQTKLPFLYYEDRDFTKSFPKLSMVDVRDLTP